MNCSGIFTDLIQTFDPIWVTNVDLSEGKIPVTGNLKQNDSIEQYIFVQKSLHKLSRKKQS